MKKFFITFLILFLYSLTSSAYIIPTNKKATFDIIRKGKIIGKTITTFANEDEKLIVTTEIRIKIKALFIPVYKFYQKSEEIWSKDNLIKFEGHTVFEDEREYFINGEDNENHFTAKGMDGELKLDKDILTLNYLNKNILNQQKIFDTQKGIARIIKVKRLDDETIAINDFDIIAEKYTLNASTNKKDKGPFPEYTIWYSKNGDLLKFKFTNWKDNKDVITQRTNWNQN